jgi:spoIIIJ-associated protein
MFIRILVGAIFREGKLQRRSIKMAIYTAATVEEAIAKGLADLGITKEKAHIHIKQAEKKGVLGFGRKDAKVEIDPIATHIIQQADRSAVRGVPEEVQEKSEPVKSASEATVELSQVVAAVKKAEAEQNVDSDEVKDSTPTLDDIRKRAENVDVDIEEIKEQVAEDEKKSQEAKTDSISEDETSEVVTTEATEKIDSEEKKGLDDDEAVAELAKYLTKISKELNAPALVRIERDGGIIFFHLDSSKQGILIGKHGKILNALQYLSQVFIHRVAKNKLSVVVNVGDYRDKRKHVLENLAKRTADKVKRTGQPVFLEPMPAFERKQIHSALANDPYITTHSEGDEPYRYLVVEKSAKQI